MFASLPVEIEHPLARVAAVAQLDEGVEAGATRSSAAPRSQDWAGVAAPALFSRAIRLYGRLRVAERMRPGDQPHRVERARSAVPALPRGRPAGRLHPLGPILDDCGLNLTVMSYLDHVDFGFIACRELVPDVDELAAAIPDALAEIVKAAGVDGSVRRRTTRSRPYPPARRGG